MDLFETIKARYSYRGAYTNAEIPQEDMNKIFEAACLSQSGYNQQTTEIVAVTDKAINAELGRIYDHEGMLTAPLNLVMVSSKKVIDGFSFEMQDYSIMTENICLALTALGYATVWTDGDTTDEDRASKVAELLGVPKDKTVRAVLPVGVPEKAGQPAKKKGSAELVHFNKY